MTLLFIVAGETCGDIHGVGLDRATTGATVGNGVVMMGGACARIGLRAECCSDVPARPHREERRRLAALARLPDVLNRLKEEAR